ncbi:MAG: hypothetical protein HUU25_13550 [Candidatus Sumerlaeia bacterium]|nr:hypothetical protein [Candidatus Sumerlaeia bacterium]
MRIQSANADGYDGNEFSGIDGDSSALTGFNLFGPIPPIGSDTLVAGASVFGQTTGNFNSGGATPGAVPFGPFVATTDVEYAIALSTTIPGDIPVSFPGGLGSTIDFIFGDGNGGAGDTARGSYTLAVDPLLTPAPIIDEMVLYSTTPSATARTRDISTAGGFSVTRATATGPGGGGDVALAITHTNPAASAFNISLAAHRFATPRNITGHTAIRLDVFGDPALSPANQNLFVGLVDSGATHFAVGVGAPNVASWSTVDLGPTSGWFLQAAGDDSALDLANIVEWRIGIQENGNAAGSVSTVLYDNLTAVNAAPAEMSVFMAD